MRRRDDPAFLTHNFDQRLVAAVQTDAGVRWREVGQLLNCYFRASRAYDASIWCKDRDAARDDLDILKRSESALRRFLTECRTREPPATCGEAADDRAGTGEDARRGDGQRRKCNVGFNLESRRCELSTS